MRVLVLVLCLSIAIAHATEVEAEKVNPQLKKVAARWGIPSFEDEGTSCCV